MSPTLITHIAALAGGGALGSFLSLTSQRFTPALSPAQWFALLCFPGSHCNHCQQRLLWRDALPLVSWPGLKGGVASVIARSAQKALSLNGCLPFCACWCCRVLTTLRRLFLLLLPPASCCSWLPSIVATSVYLTRSIICCSGLDYSMPRCPEPKQRRYGVLWRATVRCGCSPGAIGRCGGTRD